MLEDVVLDKKSSIDDNNLLKDLFDIINSHSLRYYLGENVNNMFS